MELLEEDKFDSNGSNMEYTCPWNEQRDDDGDDDEEEEDDGEDGDDEGDDDDGDNGDDDDGSYDDKAWVGVNCEELHETVEHIWTCKNVSPTGVQL